MPFHLLVVCLVVLFVLGGDVGGLLFDQILYPECRAEFAVDVAEVEDTAVEDHIEHADGFLVSGALGLENEVIVNGNRALVAFRVERFGDDADKFRIRNGNGNGKTLVAAVDHRVVALLRFVPLRIRNDAVVRFEVTQCRCGNIEGVGLEQNLIEKKSADISSYYEKNHKAYDKKMEKAFTFFEEYVQE